VSASAPLPQITHRTTCLACGDPLHENEQGDLVCQYCKWSHFSSADTREAHEHDGAWGCFGCGETYAEGIGEDDPDWFAPSVLLTYARFDCGVSLWLCERCWSDAGIEDGSHLRDLMEQLPMEARL
jgi:hypothetical protein